MNEEKNYPLGMQSENPELGYFFYNPTEADEDMEADVSLLAASTTAFAKGILQFLGGDVAGQSLGGLIVNSEDIGEEKSEVINDSGSIGQAKLESSYDEEGEEEPEEESSGEPLVVYPSHGAVFIPAEYFENEDDAKAKMNHFTASTQGEQFAEWIMERDSEAYASDVIPSSQEEVKVEAYVGEEILEPEVDENNIEEAYETPLAPGALGTSTVMAYCHVTQSMAQPLWSTGKGQGVKIAVLDTGLDLRNGLLTRGSIGGVSFVPGRRSYHDDNGHGTHVTGIIAARPGVHRTGRRLYWSIAPGAKHYTIKVLNRRGSGGWSAIARGIDRARIIGVDIIHMSLGSSRRPPVVVQRAIRHAARRQVIISSAGNSGPRAGTVGWPARYREVIGIGAIDCKRNIASFSSRGPLDPSAFVEDHVECVAPGKDVYSSKLGGGATRLTKKSGTSMSAPVVSGICALLKQKDRRLVGANRFRRRLRRSYIDLGIRGADNWYGLGMAFFHPRS